jgi:hypothetical protein
MNAIINGGGKLSAATLLGRIDISGGFVSLASVVNGLVNGIQPTISNININLGVYTDIAFIMCLGFL